MKPRSVAHTTPASSFSQNDSGSTPAMPRKTKPPSFRSGCPTCDSLRIALTMLRVVAAYVIDTSFASARRIIASSLPTLRSLRAMCAQAAGGIMPKGRMSLRRVWRAVPDVERLERRARVQPDGEHLVEREQPLRPAWHAAEIPSLYVL
jgi:hypothetical protein